MKSCSNCGTPFYLKKIAYDTVYHCRKCEKTEPLPSESDILKQKEMLKIIISITGCHEEIGELALELSDDNFEKAISFLGHKQPEVIYEDTDSCFIKFTAKSKKNYKTTIQENISNLEDKQNLESLNDIMFYIMEDIKEGQTEIILNFGKLTDERYVKINSKTKELLKIWLKEKEFVVDFKYKEKPCTNNRKRPCIVCGEKQSRLDLGSGFCECLKCGQMFCNSCKTTHDYDNCKDTSLKCEDECECYDNEIWKINIK